MNAIFGVFFAIRDDFADILQNTYPKHIKKFFGKDYDVLRSGKIFQCHPQNILHRSIVPQAILLLEEYSILAIFVDFSAYVTVCRQHKESSKMCLACQNLFRKHPKQSLTTPDTPDNIYGCLHAIQRNHQNHVFLINLPYRLQVAAKRSKNCITKAQDTINMYPKFSFILPKNHLNIIFEP